MQVRQRQALGHLDSEAAHAGFFFLAASAATLSAAAAAVVEASLDPGGHWNCPFQTPGGPRMPRGMFMFTRRQSQLLRTRAARGTSGPELASTLTAAGSQSRERTASGCLRRCRRSAIPRSEGEPASVGARASFLGSGSVAMARPELQPAGNFISWHLCATTRAEFPLPSG